MPVVQNMCKPCRSSKCIWDHIPMHETCLYLFPYLFCLGHPSRLGLQTKTTRATLLHLYSFKPYNLEMSMSSAVNIFVMLFTNTRNRISRKKWQFWFLRLIPMIQPPFNSSCVALQYEPAMEPNIFSIERFQFNTQHQLITKFQHNCMVFLKSLSSIP